MNMSATMEKMKEMRLHGMVSSLKNIMNNGLSNNLTVYEILTHLIETEYLERSNKKIERYLKQAKLRYTACFSEVDFRDDRNLDKNLMLKLSDGNWVKSNKNVIITGATGVGKSYIACALGHQACVLGFKVLYFNCSKLLSQLKSAKQNQTYSNLLKSFSKTDILILDDFGIFPLDASDRLSLLEILEDRYNKKSTIVATQIPVAKWHGCINDNTIADAILDRLIHNSQRISLNGESMRKIYGNDLTNVGHLV